MTDEIHIEPSLLLDQARASAEAAQAIGTARGAVASMNLSGGAFGLMCAFLVPVATSVTVAAERGMAAAQAMLTREADALRATARDFERAEHDVVDGLRDLGREVG